MTVASTARCDWDQLDKAIARSTSIGHANLHDGIPFPPPLCEPPDKLISDRPSERFYFLGTSMKGGQWTAEDLPMRLHVFAHIVGGALRLWWQALGVSVGS